MRALDDFFGLHHQTGQRLKRGYTLWQGIPTSTETLDHRSGKSRPPRKRTFCGSAALGASVQDEKEGGWVRLRWDYRNQLVLDLPGIGHEIKARRFRIPE